MQRTIKACLCLLAIAALLTAVGCGKKEVVSKQAESLDIYPVETILQAEQWVSQSVANTLSQQGITVQGPIRLRESSSDPPTVTVIVMLSSLNAQAGEAVSKGIASLCMQALPKYEQVSIAIDLPQESLGMWLWNNNGELVEYTPPGARR